MNQYMIKENYFVLTGAMGAGKTTVLNKIKERGYLCIDEPARIILKEQRETDGDGVPEKNAEFFNELMLSRMISEYENNLLYKEIIIFDRGIPDIIAYSELLETKKKRSEQAAVEFRYNKHVFMFNGREEIYTNDDERKVDFETANNFGINVKKIYENLNYTIIDVPFVSVDERVSFILDYISKVSSSNKFF
jgi:predicted ATPase